MRVAFTNASRKKCRFEGLDKRQRFSMQLFKTGDMSCGCFHGHGIGRFDLLPFFLLPVSGFLIQLHAPHVSPPHLQGKSRH
jgi:hypothetical protein